MLAGEPVAADSEVGCLAAFASGVCEPAAAVPAPRMVRAERGAELFDGTVWVGGSRRRVRCRRQTDRFLLEMGRLGRFEVAADGSRLRLLDASVPIAEVDLLGAIGPPLVLALALRGVWGLHASAVVAGDRVVAFVGDSGSGKSTLAAELGRDAACWLPLADDLLPVRRDAGGVVAAPRFPQARLGSARQWSTAFPQTMELAGVYLLAGSTAVGEPIVIEALAPRRASLALVRGTAGSGLFDPRLLARHLELCVQLTAAVPVARLRYPHRLEMVPQVGRAILADIEGGPGAAA